MNKKNKGLVATIVISVIGTLLISALAFISRGFRSWDLDAWKSDILEIVPTPSDSEESTEEPVEEDPSSEEPSSQPLGRQIVIKEANTFYNLTVLFSPTDAIDKRVTWTLAWAEDGDSLTDDNAWKYGKSVTTYVTITPTTQYATTAILASQLPFATQIKLTVTSVANPAAKAVCNVDYRKKPSLAAPTPATVTMVDSSTPVGYSVNAVPTINYSIGTLPYEGSTGISYDYLSTFHLGAPINGTLNSFTAKANSGSNVEVLSYLQTYLTDTADGSFTFSEMFNSALTGPLGGTTYMADNLIKWFNYHKTAPLTFYYNAFLTADPTVTVACSFNMDFSDWDIVAQSISLTPTNYEF